MTFDNLILLTGSGTRWLQLFISLSLLIVLHEFGHFYFAKKFKMRVERFYLFFDFLFPFSNVLNFSLFKKKKNDTEYGVGWFPLGGYVKIAGMVDESNDKEQLAQAPQEWEYRSKPAWQRFFTMMGGIIVNILVAMIIYAFVFSIWGDKYLPTENVKYGIHTDTIGKNLGLQNGDKIVGLDGKKTERWNELSYAIIIKGAKSLEITRDNQLMSIKLPDSLGATLNSRKQSLFEPRYPAVVGGVVEKSEAEKMGLQAGDSIITINDQPIVFFDDIQTQLKGKPKTPVRIVAFRKQSKVILSGATDSNAKLGVGPIDNESAFAYKTIRYNPIQAIGKGISYTGQQFMSYATGLSVFGKKGFKVSENLGGIGSFSKVFNPVFDLKFFLLTTALISVILAFMNLLPIPGLDGGYVIFLLYEMITRRKVSDKVMGIATTIGLVLLLGLMLYANGLDIFREWKLRK